MRNFLVKYFALSYHFKILGWKTHWVRAANIIFPLFYINAIYVNKTGTFSFDTFIGGFLAVILFVALFIAFGYFKIWPLKWDELTENQKWQYGNIVNGVSYLDNLTPVQQNVWEDLDAIYYHLYTKMNALTWPPIIMAVTTIITILILCT